MQNIVSEEVFDIIDPKYAIKRTHDEDEGIRWLKEGGWPPGYKPAEGNSVDSKQPAAGHDKSKHA